MKIKKIEYCVLLTSVLLSGIIALSSCKKENTKNSDNGSYYYTATIGGVQYSQKATEINGYEAGSAIGGSDDVTFSATINPKDYPYPAESTTMDITKGMFHNYFDATNEQFKAFFPPGVTNFTSGPEYDPFKFGDGFIIEWFDENDVDWSTAAGTGDQTNSTIKIVSVKESPSIVDYYLEVKLQFSCKLYNSNTGEMKQLTNGEFVGLFGKF
jgi:hypothetical protein